MLYYANLRKERSSDFNLDMTIDVVPKWRATLVGPVESQEAFLLTCKGWVDVMSLHDTMTIVVFHDPSDAMLLKLAYDVFTIG